MPLLHRYLGNPVLTRDRPPAVPQPGARLPLRAARLRPGPDPRARTADHGHGIRQRDGRQGDVSRAWRIREVPTTLRKDGRSRPPHLRTWRDGWRHLRFLLLHSPRWMFLYPGLGAVPRRRDARLGAARRPAPPQPEPLASTSIPSSSPASRCSSESRSSPSA